MNEPKKPEQSTGAIKSEIHVKTNGGVKKPRSN